MIALALALQLLATSPADSSGMGATPPAPGAPRFVQLGGISGVPPDSSLRAQFVTAFRSVFAEDELPGERLSGGDEWRSGLPLPNRFRLLEGDPADDAWIIDVSVGAPPPFRTPKTASRSSYAVPTRRTSRGMIVAFVLHVPDPGGGPSHAESARFAFAFPASRTGTDDLAIPTTGYAFPWAGAGRVAGFLALEALHRSSGDILSAERMDIQPAVRLDAGR